MLEFLKILSLFVVTALAEIIGCYLPWLVLTQGRPRWLLIPAAVSLALFAWLLTLHPGAAGAILPEQAGADGLGCDIALRDAGAARGEHDARALGDRRGDRGHRAKRPAPACANRRSRARSAAR